ARQMHLVRFWTDGFAGAVNAAVHTPGGWKPAGWYASHPQLIAIPVYLWTGLFGFEEWSARSLTATVSLLTTALLWLAARERHGARRATLFAAFWVALPAVVVYGRNLEHVPFVAFFLAWAALAQEKTLAGRERWAWVWAAAMAGLV